MEVARKKNVEGEGKRKNRSAERPCFSCVSLFDRKSRSRVHDSIEPQLFAIFYQKFSHRLSLVKSRFSRSLIVPFNCRSSIHVRSFVCSNPRCSLRYFIVFAGNVVNSWNSQCRKSSRPRSATVNVPVIITRASKRKISPVQRHANPAVREPVVRGRNDLSDRLTDLAAGRTRMGFLSRSQEAIFSIAPVRDLVLPSGFHPPVESSEIPFSLSSIAPRRTETLDQPRMERN